MNFKRKKESQQNKLSKTAIVFYVIAAIFLAGFIAVFYNVTVYIMSVLESGTISLSTDWLNIFIYYVNNTFAFLAYAVVSFGAGYIIQLIKNANAPVAKIEEEVVDTAEDVIESVEPETVVE